MLAAPARPTLVLALSLYELRAYADILDPVEYVRLGRVSAASGSADLLLVSLHAAEQTGKADVAYVGLADLHLGHLVIPLGTSLYVQEYGPPLISIYPGQDHRIL